ncbi:MAG: hypothetical protein ACP5XB_29790, partial [Isosphaeraceae bacterium]
HVWGTCTFHEYTARCPNRSTRFLGETTLYRDGADLELPSDITGVVYTLYNTQGHWKLSLAQELKAAGYNVDANKLI